MHFHIPVTINDFIAAYNQPRNLIKGFDKELFDHQTIHYLGNILYLAICKIYVYYMLWNVLDIVQHIYQLVTRTNTKMRFTKAQTNRNNI